MNKFRLLAKQLYQLQAQHFSLPHEVYEVLQGVMFELNSVEPLSVSQINNLVSQIDASQSPGKMTVDLLRLLEKEHGIYD